MNFSDQEKTKVRFFHARRSFLRRCTWTNATSRLYYLKAILKHVLFLTMNFIVRQSPPFSEAHNPNNKRQQTTSTFQNNIYIYIYIYFIVKDHGRMSHEDKIR
jgi:hypothetical protein